MMQGLVSGKHRAREKSGTEATHFTIDGEWSSMEDSSGILLGETSSSARLYHAIHNRGFNFDEALHVSKHL
jgi:hypothetical protein